MTKEQFNNLKVGDIITFNSSVSPRLAGRRCSVTSVFESTRINHVCAYVEELGNMVPLYPDCVEPYVLSPVDNVDTDGSILL